MARHLRRITTVVMAMVVGVLTATMIAAVPASAATRDPVLFVHGFGGDAANWNEMIADFRAQGYSASELDAWQYDSSLSNATIAQQLSAEVTRLLASTGAAKVDIVAHSMGSLSSRYYLKNLGGGARVDDWASLGGPNHGTSSANLCAFLVSCREMQIGSAFLTNLNATDETPGTVTYGTFWSFCDEVINPDQSVPLSGAANTSVGCVGHLALLTNDSVSSRVRAFVA